MNQEWGYMYLKLYSTVRPNMYLLFIQQLFFQVPHPALYIKASQQYLIKSTIVLSLMIPY